MKAQQGSQDVRTAVTRPTVLMILLLARWTCTLSLPQTAASSEANLTKLVDLPLPGKASRFDYQSYDPTTKRLYFSHMGDGELVVLDTETRKIVAHIPGFPTTTGVLVVPELHKVFVSVPGNHEVAVVDTQTLKVLARIPDGEFPDGLAYAP